VYSWTVFESEAGLRESILTERFYHEHELLTINQAFTHSIHLDRYAVTRQLDQDKKPVCSCHVCIPRIESNFVCRWHISGLPLIWFALVMANLSDAIVGEFIDALVNDRQRAEVLLSVQPDLLNARWIHDETVVHFLRSKDSSML
jgi:hypothetical protein